VSNAQERYFRLYNSMDGEVNVSSRHLPVFFKSYLESKCVTTQLKVNGRPEYNFSEFRCFSDISL